jgi:hypothetical protein
MDLTARVVGPFVLVLPERIVAGKSSSPLLEPSRELGAQKSPPGAVRGESRGVPMRVLHKTRAPDKIPARHGPIPVEAERAARFGLHFLEMCAVMCLGGGLLIALFFGAAAFLGFSDLRQEDPALSALVVAVLLAGAMVGWMRFRRMDRRPTLEMAGSSVAAGVLLVVGYWLGFVPESALLPSVCVLACVAMVAVMLFRLPLYTSSHSAHRAHPD